MTFKESRRKQTFLLPPSFHDFLGEGHEAVVLDEFMQELDTKALEQSYHNEHGGSSAYHPAMLLAVLVYGYMSGIFSSRKIAKHLSQDIAFMYLAGNLKPDFRTLARFRKEKGKYLESVMISLVGKAKELGLVAFATCSLDGTKLKANASKDKNVRKDELAKNIRQLLEEAERIDAEEDILYGDQEDAEDPELKTKAGREKRKKELEAKRKKEEGKLEKLGDYEAANLTDPDARLMKLKQGAGFGNAYNIQCVTENGIILSGAISASRADQPTLIPSLEKFQAEHGRLPEKLLADKGYASEDNYAFCEANGIDAYIPPNREPANLSGYQYDTVRDTYTDAKGRVYRFKQHAERRKELSGKERLLEGDAQRQHAMYRSTVYEYQNKRTGAKKYVRIFHGWQEHAQKQRKKLALPFGRALYKKRLPDVEGVFANIKKNLGFTAFNLRGLAGVMAEWTLISLAHNLKKVM
jgi:transposase